MALSETALRRYDRLLGTYRNRTAALVVIAWDRLGSYDESGIAEFTATTAPALQGAKRATVAASTSTFALALGIRPPSISANDVDTEPRIRHPFLAMWHAVNEGRPNDEAIAAGRSQAQAVALDFVQQTSRRTGDVVAESAGVRTRWRRVPNAGACTWCRTISGQLYRTAESADFGHDRCYCMVVPEA
jgi:hypothetical protein